MSILYLTHQGARLRREAECLVVEKQGRRLARVPAFQVERVLVFGHSELTSGAVDLLLSRGIECAFVSMSGRLKGRLVSPHSGNAILRVAQFDRGKDESFCLKVSKGFVEAKLKNQRTLLRRFDRSHDELEFTVECGRLTEAQEQLGSCETLAAVRGVEGAGARAYFAALRRAVPSELSAAKRERRPPKDPFNALLGLGYALLFNELLAAVTARGFDPAVGFFHALRPGRETLALDLMEEFRAPVADRLVLRVLNLKQIRVEDFEEAPTDSRSLAPCGRSAARLPGGPGGLHLRPEALRLFLKEYEELVAKPFKDRETGRETSLRRKFGEQTERLARVVRASREKDTPEAEYEGFLWEG